MKRRTALTSLATGVAGSLLPKFALGESTQSAWRTGADLPLSVQEIYPALHRGEMVIAGGIASRLKVPYFTDRCIAYNPEQNQWRELPALPEALHHAALVEHQGRLLLAGGFNGGYTHIWRMRGRVLELTEDGWAHRGELPQPQAEGVLTQGPQGLLHLVTGQSPTGNANNKRTDHRQVTAHWVWDGKQTQWQSAAPIPTARNSATGGWVDGQLVVAGGRTNAGNLATTQIYDPATDRWHDARPMPLAQAGTASVVYSNSLVVFGGEIFKPEAGVFKEVWRYTPNTDTWEALPHLPTPRHGLGAVRIGTTAYVAGGATKPSGSGTSSRLEMLDLGNL